MSSKTNSELKWTPFGGLGEVGMNCMVFEFGPVAVPVDAGILFANSNDFGIENLHPDFEEILVQKKPKSWIITHGHEDHIGGVPALFRSAFESDSDLPQIFAPPLAAALISEKLKDQIGTTALGQSALKQIIAVEFTQWIELTVGLKVMFVPNRHSTPQSCSLFFKWESGKKNTRPMKIFHSSDFKLDFNKFEDGHLTLDKYKVFDEEGGADIAFIDSTNAEREGHSVSEIEVLPALESLTQKSEGRVYVSLFSSNLYRMAALAKMGAAAGRVVCLAGRSLQRTWALGQELGFGGSEIPDTSGVTFVSSTEINRVMPEKQFIICTGSQGEGRSVLSRLASGSHSELVVDFGDTVILSSKVIPGNEKSVSRILNGLLRRGAQVYWSEKVKSDLKMPIHASGHGRREEIKMLIETLKPKHVVPVHGELRQLHSCRDIALEVGIQWGLQRENIFVVENGTQLVFSASPTGCKFLGKENLPLPPRILQFSNFWARSKDEFLKFRKQAATGGVVSGFIDSAGRTRVSLRGVAPENVSLDISDLEKWLENQYRGLLREGGFRSHDPDLEKTLGEELARYMKRTTGLRPVCVIHLIGL